MLVVLLAFRQSLHLEGEALFDRGNRAVAVLACAVQILISMGCENLSAYTWGRTIILLFCCCCLVILF